MFTILTMSRSDQVEIVEWIKYHSQIGFDEFIIILDNPNDNSELILKEMSKKFNINILIKPEYGEYFHDQYKVPSKEYYKVIERWRKDNAEHLLKYRAVIDPLSLRQAIYFTEELEKIGKRKNGWVCIIDVDEYIVLEKYKSIQNLVESTKFDRIGFLNFNFDMSNHKKGTSVINNNTFRCSREEIISYGKGFESRVKSIVKYEKCLPFDTVHSISFGPRYVPDYNNARLHHYRFVKQIEIKYDTIDETLKGFLNKNE